VSRSPPYAEIVAARTGEDSRYRLRSKAAFGLRDPLPVGAEPASRGRWEAVMNPQVQLGPKPRACHAVPEPDRD
jgi:hypothetical protein